VEEITDILKKLPVQIVSLDNFPEAPEVEEDGKTLEQNATKKARTIAKLLKRWTIDDDTGLEVDYLNGEPGVYSARWAGPGCTYKDNNKKLLASLKGVPEKKRTASFRCVIAIANPKGKVWTVEGRIKGVIATKTKGRRGFGYDPVFFVPKENMTFAELPSEIKNRISHRARALQKAKKLLRELLEK
jgi:XTP/dITP diphosphohydrolase